MKVKRCISLEYLTKDVGGVGISHGANLEEREEFETQFELDRA
jgi:hypothetical protein